MNLLEQMNAEEFRKLLEFKEKFPIIGLDLVRALTEKTLPIQLTLGECIDLSNAIGIPYGQYCNQIFATFISKP
jgi:hypothetical protein